MLDIGQRVECVDSKSTHRGKKGTFTGWVANALKVLFDDGKEGLFLPSDLKKINQ